MIKFEIREGNTSIQFDTLELAQAYNSNVQVFEVEVPDIILPNIINWTGFKNAIFENKPLLLKCMPCNAYPLVADMIISAEAGATVYESNFLMGWQLLQSQLVGKGTPLTTNEIEFINSNFATYNFSITI